jgi:hypothetical protein
MNNDSRIAVYRQHSLVKVKRHPLKTFKVPKVWPRIDPSMIAGTQELSHQYGRELRTTLIAINYEDEDRNVVLETVDSDCPFYELAESLMQVFGVHDKPSYTKQRNVRKRNGKFNGRSFGDGRRGAPKPVVLVFNNLESSLGRLFRSNKQFKRAVRSGETSVKVTIGDGELEIAKLIPGGSGCSFEFYWRNGGQIVRIIGKSINSYLDGKPADNAKSFLGRTIAVEVSEEWSHRSWESFSEQEKDVLRSHVATEAQIARELYEGLYDWLQGIDPHIIRRDGTLPSSAAGAGIKIAFSMSEVEEWDRPTDRVTQVGALSVAGGRYFTHVDPGYFDDLHLYDGKSWHGFLMSLLPDPATCRYIDIAPGAFDIDQWIGQFGCLCISGTVHDTSNPPIREHDLTTRRLRYIKSSFTRIWTTIPEIVIGVVSGRMSVTHIHDGVHMVGSNEHSFLRKFAMRMEAIKDTAEEGSPLYILSKKLTNYVPGKLIEIYNNHPYIDPVDRKIMVPLDAGKSYKEIVNAYVDGSERLEELATKLFNESRFQDEDDEMTFGKFLDRHLPSSATTGPYYLPMHGSQIWGMSSAQLGLVASLTNAISGYTDGFITIGDASSKLEQYRNTIQKAGYEAPSTGFGSFQPKISNGRGWIVKPGLWSIRYQHIDTETGEVTQRQKDALHGLPDLDSNDAWDVISRIAESKRYSYQSVSRPATLMEAYQQHIEPGTMISQPVTLDIGKPESSAVDVDRSVKLLQSINNNLANSSSISVPTMESSRGCVKLLSEYGLTHVEIAERTGVSVKVINDISRGHRPGHKHLEALQQLVAQVESRLAVS